MQYTADPFLTTHLSVLAQPKQFLNKILYSLQCLSGCVSHSNSNRNRNIISLANSLPILLNLFYNMRNTGVNMQYLYLLLTLFNTLLAKNNELTYQQYTLIFESISYVDCDTNNISDTLMCYLLTIHIKFKYQDILNKHLLLLMATKMTYKQVIYLMLTLRNGEMDRADIIMLIRIGEKFNCNSLIVYRILDTLYKHLSGICRKYIVEMVYGFLCGIVGRNLPHYPIKYMVARIIQELKTRCLVVARMMPNMQVFLMNCLMAKTNPLYLPSSDRFITDVNSLKTILDGPYEKVISGQDYRLALHYYYKHALPWTEYLLMTKGITLAHRFLCRASDKFNPISNTPILTINENYYIKYSKKVGIECLRSVPGMIVKLLDYPSPHHALYVIRNLHKVDTKHPQYSLLLLQIHKIALCNKSYKSLRQIEKTIVQEYTSEFVLGKLKQIEVVSYRKQVGYYAKSYFIWLPLLCSGRYIYSNVSGELSEIFLHETIPIYHKFYVAEDMVRKMQRLPVEKFMGYLVRQLDTGMRKQIYGYLKYYLYKGVKMKESAAIYWLTKEFGEQLERILYNIFARLLDFHEGYITELLFLLDKYGVFGGQWLHMYRWSLASLEDVMYKHQDHTLDCLYLFETLLYKIPVGEIPRMVADKFRTSVMRNWGKYTAEHLFAIERILQLFDYQCPISFMRIELPTIEDVINRQKYFDKLNEYYRDYYLTHPTTKYICQVTHNAFFGHIDKSQAILLILTVFSSWGSQQKQENKEIVNNKDKKQGQSVSEYYQLLGINEPDNNTNQGKQNGSQYPISKLTEGTSKVSIEGKPNPIKYKYYNDSEHYYIGTITECNLMVFLNLLIWFYQNSEDDLDVSLETFLTDLLHTTSQCTVPSLREAAFKTITTKCLELLSTVNHKINFLKLPLTQFLRTHHDSIPALHSLVEIFSIVAEAKPKSLYHFKLQPIILSTLFKMIYIYQLSLTVEYIDLIETLCFVECQYSNLLEDSLHVLCKILEIESYGMSYRSELVEFVLSTLDHYEYVIESYLVWFLMAKYFELASIISLLLAALYRTSYGKMVNSDNIDYRLLMRLMLTHNNDYKLQYKLKRMFNKYVPIQSKENEFMVKLKKGDYEGCEKLVETVGNPYQLKIYKYQVQGLLKWDYADSKCKKLLRFLFEYPPTKEMIVQCPELFIYERFFEYLLLLDNVLQEEQKLNNLSPKEFDIQQGFMLFERRTTDIVMAETIALVLTDKSSQLYLLKLFTAVLQRHDYKVYQFILFFGRIVLELQPNNRLPASKILLDIVTNLYNTPYGQLTSDRMIKVQVAATKLKYYLYMFLPRASITSETNSVSFGFLCQHFLIHVLAWRNAMEKNYQRVEYLNWILLAMMERMTQGKESKEEQVIAVLSVFSHIHMRSAYAHTVGLSATIVEGDALLLKNMLQLCNNIFLYYSSRLSGACTTLRRYDAIGFLTMSLYLAKYGIYPNDVVFKSVKTYFDKQCKNGSLDNSNYEINNQLLKAYEYLNQLESTKSVEIFRNVQAVYYQRLKEKSDEGYRTNKRVVAVSQTSENYQVEDSYVKYRLIEEQTKVINKSNRIITVIVMDYTVSEGQLEEKYIQPNYSITDIAKFPYNPCFIPPYTDTQVTLEYRNQNLKTIQDSTHKDISLCSLKEHSKFLSSLVNLDYLNYQYFDQLLKSIAAVIYTVYSHHYYCKKVIDLEIVSKLIILFKKIQTQSKVQQDKSQQLSQSILKLCLAVSSKKYKKLVVFNDDTTVQFFKTILKQSINQSQALYSNLAILEIMKNCKNTTYTYYRYGLISMIIELANREYNTRYVLAYFLHTYLDMNIINEIYQRGMFNRMIDIFTKDYRGQSNDYKEILNYWIKLAGKVCINTSIQGKYIDKKLHICILKKIDYLNMVDDRSNLAYFFAYLTLKNDMIGQWLIETKLPYTLFLSLRYSRTQYYLYLFFYHFCFGNNAARDYCFRIKYHLHLIERISEDEATASCNYHYKYLYKSLGQMMASRPHQQLFFKEEVVRKLVAMYTVKPEPSIYYCFLDLVATLETEAYFDELRRQNFWESLKIFEYKISSEATYSYLLQIFLIMIKKGRTKEFSQAEVRAKTCLKAEYSINLYGKELALRFIIALSAHNKYNYLTERCVRLLASLMGLNVTRMYLTLICDMLMIKGSISNLDFLNFFGTYNICDLIADSMSRYNYEDLYMAIGILLILSSTSHNHTKIVNKYLTSLVKQLQNCNDKVLGKLLSLVGKLTDEKGDKYLIYMSYCWYILTDKYFIKRIGQPYQLSAYETTVSNLLRNKIYYGSKYQYLVKTLKLVGGTFKEYVNHQPKRGYNNNVQAIKELQGGKKVKMYKIDGSVSYLTLFLTTDMLYLNCAISLLDVVKQKWRLPLNEISSVMVYKDGQSSYHFLNSVFERNSGLFSSASPCENCLSLIGRTNYFHINFSNKYDCVKWQGFIREAIDSSRNLLKKLK